MKRDIMSKFWIFLYVNLWYVPLFAFLLGVKISLISMLADSMSLQKARTTDDVLQNERFAQQFIPSPRAHTPSPGNKTVKRSVNLGWQQQLRLSHQPLSSEDWKLLENLEDATIVPSADNRTDKESIWVILNQVPWGGGDLIDNLLLELQEQNNFKHLQHEYRTPWPRFLLEEEQKSLVTWFEYQHLPRSYDRHFYFVNFTKYQQYVFENPIYINMVQDPLARIRLAFNWKRSDKVKAQQEVDRRNEIEEGSGQDWLQKDFQDCVLKADPECSYEDGSQDFTLMVPFFCGQLNSCVVTNDRWALQMAKFNIEKYYSVVGVFERLQESLFLFEKYIPKFFTGATNFEPEKIHPDPPPVSREVREMMKDKLRSEYELYDFIVQRLQQQMLFLSNSPGVVTENSDLK